ncbi:hypothetical protein Unana1_03553 [Umbelopsis nana]
MPSSNPADQQQACGCSTDSPIYARMWPLIFFVSALTDFPMPPPKGKKQGQHRDWGFLPVFVVLGLIAISTYSYIARVCRGVTAGVTANATTSSAEFTTPTKLERETSFPVQALLNVAELDNRHTDDTNSESNPPTLNEDQVSKPDDQEQTAGVSATNEGEESNGEKALVPAKDLEKEPVTPRPPIDFESILPQTKWCKKCNCWKPDRTHHCSICDECVLKMDHHCPWVNGCVGYNNYRFFIQFLCYTSVSCCWMLITTAVAFARFGRMETFDGYAIVALVISGIVSLLVGAFTCAHLGLVTLGRTTIENKIYHAWDITRPEHDQRFQFQRTLSIKLQSEKDGNREREMEEGRVQKKEDGAVAKPEKPMRLPETFTLTGKNLYNNGVWYNWRDVMGPNVLLWFVPIGNSPGNGLEFRYNAVALAEYNQEERNQKKEAKI